MQTVATAISKFPLVAQCRAPRVRRRPRTSSPRASLGWLQGQPRASIYLTDERGSALGMVQLSKDFNGFGRGRPTVLLSRAGDKSVTLSRLQVEEMRQELCIRATAP